MDGTATSVPLLKEAMTILLSCYLHEHIVVMRDDTKYNVIINIHIIV